MTVLIVGGGPAGALVGIHLARAGIEVSLVERSPAYRWRACGVFSSPVTLGPLRDAGLTDRDLARIARPIPAMRLETPRGAVVRLTYGADAGAQAGAATAVGFDRSALDPCLLDLARRAGVDVRLGVQASSLDIDARGIGAVVLRTPDGSMVVRPRVVVGADGIRSVVSRAAGVARDARLPARIGLTHHRADARGTSVVDARMRLLDGGYVGVAPVPGDRVNVGVVLDRSWTHRLRETGAGGLVDRIVAGIPTAGDDAGSWRTARPDDARERVAGVAPLGGRVARRAGRGWLVIGDAAGFLDPFTGEGLHRAFVSAELAAAAILAALRAGSAGHGVGSAGFPAYERAMRRRFSTKDAVSWLVQLFLARPALFEYVARRLAARPSVRATMALVMGDLVPASRGLDPRFLAALLAP